jgi:hypothetical protein
MTHRANSDALMWTGAHVAVGPKNDASAELERLFMSLVGLLQ